jgi:hypothetical protein
MLRERSAMEMFTSAGFAGDWRLKTRCGFVSQICFWLAFVLENK